MVLCGFKRATYRKGDDGKGEEEEETEEESVKGHCF
jgi:hypothetical protein